MEGWYPGLWRIELVCPCDCRDAAVFASDQQLQRLHLAAGSQRWDAAAATYHTYDQGGLTHQHFPVCDAAYWLMCDLVVNAAATTGNER